MSDPIKNAQADIKNGTIKIYFEAVSYAPIPLGLDMYSRKDWPEYDIQYIGNGCSDIIHSPECDEEYMKNHYNMVEYGTLYNKEIARHFGLKTA